MHVRPAQITPMHFHWRKYEDIINRGGGNLIIEIWHTAPDKQLANRPVTIAINDCLQTQRAGSQLCLVPADNICLPAGIYHSFRAEQGACDWLVKYHQSTMVIRTTISCIRPEVITILKKMNQRNGYWVLGIGYWVLCIV